ncbi:MAG TPA: FHA domain-containing protein, partial [Ktedonobacterales bacterium]|nr:FHA domain-containing protein [Ktedonobacterales bacterium]
MGGALLGPFGRQELGASIVTIGRRACNTIVLHDTQASSLHAELRPDGAGYVLIDLGSTNGTRVNGQPVAAHTHHALHAGDVITIGDTALTVELASAQLPPTARLNAPAPSVSGPERWPRRGLGPLAPVGRSRAPASAPTQRVAAPSIDVASPPAPASPPPRPDYRATAAAPPAYAPQPPYRAGPIIQAPPAKKSASTRRILFIVGGSLALALVVCVTLGVVVFKYIYAHTPQGVVEAYYANLQSQQYFDAYGYMDHMNQQLFTIEAHKRGLTDGGQLFDAVFSCLDHQFGHVSR